MTGIGELRDKYKSQLTVPTPVGRLPTPPQAPASVEAEPETFVIESEKGVFLTGPAETLSPERQAAWEKASTANPSYLYMQGRFVEADNPNRNKAFWTTTDLVMGQPTVANGPLNWIHDERHIIGTLTDSELIYRETAAAGELGTHIEAMSVVWQFLYPVESRIIEKASADHQLWYSMECVSQTVTCVDSDQSPGCGKTVSYTDYQKKQDVCEHLREKSSLKRFGDPTFQGGAVIIPPVRPGWQGADLQVMRQAAELTENNHLDTSLTRKEAEAMVAMVISYANTK